MAFLISAAGNGLLYFKIIITLSGRDILQTSESTEDLSVEVTRVRNQVARTLIITGIVFFVCQISSRIGNLDDVFDYLHVNFDILNHKEEATVTAVGHAFLFLNSIINPFIYVFSCEHYRQGMIEAFCGHRKTSSQENSGTMMQSITTTGD